MGITWTNGRRSHHEQEDLIMYHMLPITLLLKQQVLRCAVDVCGRNLLVRHVVMVEMLAC